MNGLELTLYVLFFVVNSFALCFLVWYVQSTVRRMENRLGETITFMRWVKSRHDTTHMYTLCRFQEILIREERYEDAAKVQKMIDEEMEDWEIITLKTN